VINQVIKTAGLAGYPTFSSQCCSNDKKENGMKRLYLKRLSTAILSCSFCALHSSSAEMKSRKDRAG
jgi:hypothetical protein